jgi:hypothetical protein
LKIKCRDRERFGPVSLSVQASRRHYCHPRVDYDDISQYMSVEVALFDKDGAFIAPRDIGLKRLRINRYFTDDQGPAGWVPLKDVDSLRRALERKFKKRG